MTKQECAKVLATLQACYSNFGKHDKEIMLSVWTYAFEDFEARIVYEAVMRWINSNKFAPTIADIKKDIYDKHTRHISHDEITRSIRKAVREGVYTRIGTIDYRQAYANLPDLVQEIMDPSELEDFAFMNDFEGERFLKQLLERYDGYKTNEYTYFLESKAPMGFLESMANINVLENNKEM